MNQAGGPVFHARGMSKAEYARNHRFIATGEVKRLHSGVYIETAVFEQFSTENQTKLSIVAAALHLDLPVVGLAAAFLHQLPLPANISNPRAELGKRQRSGRKHATIRFRTMITAPPSHLTTRNSSLGRYSLTSVARTCVDIARWHGVEDAVAAMDHALRKSLTTATELDEVTRDLHRSPGARLMREAIKLATPWSESPRESLVKVRMFRAGMPAPLQQASIFDEDGHFLARLDFLYEDISMGIEYDGTGKWEGEFGEDPVLSLSREIHRQDMLARAGILIHRINKRNLANENVIDLIKEIHAKRSRTPNPFPPSQFQSPGRAW